MAVRAVSDIGVIVCFPLMQRRFGTVRVFQANMLAWPFVVGFFPVLNILARKGMEGGLAFNALLMVFFAIWSFAGTAWRELLPRQ